MAFITGAEKPDLRGLLRISIILRLGKCAAFARSVSFKCVNLCSQFRRLSILGVADPSIIGIFSC